MPKLQNVTNDDLAQLDAAIDEVRAQISGLNDRMEKGYCDEVKNPIELARHFTAMSRECSEMVTNLLRASYMQEQRREVEAMLKARDKT